MTVRIGNENGQHALDPVRRACPARPLIRPPLLYPAGHIAYWYPTRYAQLFAPLKDGALGGHSSGPTTC